MHYVEIDLDRPRKLRFDLAALQRLQQRVSEKGIAPVLQRLDQLDIEVIVAAYWIGLSHEDKDLTPDKARQLLEAKIQTGDNVPNFSRLVATAIAYAAGFAPKENAEGKAEAPTVSGT